MVYFENRICIQNVSSKTVSDEVLHSVACLCRRNRVIGVRCQSATMGWASKVHSPSEIIQGGSWPFKVESHREKVINASETQRLDDRKRLLERSERSRIDTHVGVLHVQNLNRWAN
jgi:hypothetical protein